MPLKKRSGQAALEFLTTYAWAFLVIMITMGALYYFGLFDFGKYVPERCLFPSQFSCADFIIRTDRVSVKLANNIGETLSVTGTSITSDTTPPISCNSPPVPLTWVSGTTLDVNFTGCNGGAIIAGERSDVKVSLLYYAINTPSRPIHTISGKISGRVLS